MKADGNYMKDETIQADANGDVIGWVFGVPSVFLRAAMGFKETKGEVSGNRQARLWTRKQPILRTFKLGDVFYEPPAARHLVWKDALKILRHAVQIVSATPDHAGARRGSIERGQIEFTVTDYAHGKAQRSTKHRTTQEQFEEFLRAGRTP